MTNSVKGMNNEIINTVETSSVKVNNAATAASIESVEGTSSPEINETAEVKEAATTENVESNNPVEGAETIKEEANEDVKPEEVPNIMPLAYLENNRPELDHSNIVKCYNKIKTYGHLKSEPIKYIAIDDLVPLLNGRKLLKLIMVAKNNKKELSIDNFKVTFEEIQETEYKNYLGAIIDGQHREAAHVFGFANPNIKPVLQRVEDIPDNISDILTLIALINDGKSWKGNDYNKSGLSTGNEYMNYILSKQDVYPIAFLIAIFSLNKKLSQSDITAALQGYNSYKKNKINLDDESQKMGDQILKIIDKNKFLSKDRLTGKFGLGIKAFYNDLKDINTVLKVLKAINKEYWETHILNCSEGKSLESKAYCDGMGEINKILGNK